MRANITYSCNKLCIEGRRRFALGGQVYVLVTMDTMITSTWNSTPRDQIKRAVTLVPSQRPDTIFVGVRVSPVYTSRMTDKKAKLPRCFMCVCIGFITICLSQEKPQEKHERFGTTTVFRCTIM